MDRITSRKQICLIVGLTFIVMSCMCGPGSLRATPVSPTEISPPATESLPHPTEIIPTDTPLGNEEITPTMETEPVGLQPEVPWMIVSTTDGLWAANMDGSGLTLLIPKSYQEFNLSRSISSAAHKIAFLTSEGDSYHGLALNVISLPDAKTQKLTDLTTKDTEPGANAAPGESDLEAMRAITEQPSYAWSPDGKKLAFIGALDNPKADVYVYDMDSQKIQKVSQGTGQDFSPNWSPDGKSILYFEAEGFGTGAGYSMKEAWLAAADGSGSSSLYTPKSGGEELLGWRDEKTAVLTSWNPSDGTNALRLYDIRAKKQIILDNGPISGAAFATGIGDNAGSIIYSNDKGLFIVPSGVPKPQKLTSDLVSSYGYPTAIQWQEYGGIFIVHFADGKLSTFMADGSQQQNAPFNPSSGTLEVASFGLIWGWTNNGGETEGAWISGPGLNTSQIFNGPASFPIWNIDNDLIFFAGQDLYQATFDNFYSDTTPIGTLTGQVLDVSWVGFSEALDNKYGP